MVSLRMWLIQGEIHSGNYLGIPVFIPGGANKTRPEVAPTVFFEPSRAPGANGFTIGNSFVSAAPARTSSWPHPQSKTAASKTAKKIGCLIVCQ